MPLIFNIIGSNLNIFIIYFIDIARDQVARENAHFVC